MSAFCAGCGCFRQCATRGLRPASAMSGCTLCCARRSGVPAEVPRRAGQTLPLVLQASLAWRSVGSIGARLGHHSSCQMRCIQGRVKSTHISTSQYVDYVHINVFSGLMWFCAMWKVTHCIIHLISLPAGQNECGGQGRGSPTIASSQ